MYNIIVPAVWFYILCFLLFILTCLAVLLLILQYKMKSKIYRQLQEPNESIVPTINSNRYNIQLQNRKESDRLRLMFADFKSDQCQLPLTDSSSADYRVTSQDIMKPEERENDSQNPKNNHAVQPPLLVRQQMEQIINELLHTRSKKKSTSKVDDIEESCELRNLNKVKNQRKTFRASTRHRSKSTTDLDIYDVLPNPQPLTVNADEEHEKYSLPKNQSVVVVEDDSGYLLPLSLKISYANANVK